MPWICASCTAEHESNDPPCRECAHEQFAQLDDTRTIEQIDEVAHVEWICVGCGENHLQNNPPCSSCGSMQIRRVEPATESDGGHAIPASKSTRDDSESDSNRKSWFFIGAVLGVLGVVFLPFFFFLIAMPESIYRMRGGSIQDHLGEDARDNPALAGSMLVMAWFGNFLWLVLILAFVAGFLIALF